MRIDRNLLWQYQAFDKVVQIRNVFFSFLFNVQALHNSLSFLEIVNRYPVRTGFGTGKDYVHKYFRELLTSIQTVSLGFFQEFSTAC